MYRFTQSQSAVSSDETRWRRHTGGESDTSVNEKIKFRKQIQKIKNFSSRALEANNGREIMNIVL